MKVMPSVERAPVEHDYRYYRWVVSGAWGLRFEQKSLVALPSEDMARGR